MPIKKEKTKALKLEMERLHIFEEDLEESFILASKKGGQKVNKTSSCVYLVHLPTKISVKCDQDRSRELNRYHARKMLCDKIKSQVFQEKTTKEKKLEKLKKQKKRRLRKTKKKMEE